MPETKNALLRYKIIDQLLGQQGGLVTLEQLLNSLNDRLRYFNGPDAGVSMRTLKEDIRVMRLPSPEGFDAPIVNHWGKGLYEYSDKKFSIFNLRLSDSDRKKLSDALQLLNQIEGLPHYDYLEEIMARLRLFETKDDSGSEQLIFFEESVYPYGAKWLKLLHEAIVQKKCLKIDYAPFVGDRKTFILAPWFLKEYRNRWYLYGWCFETERVLNLALDRMAEVVPSIREYEDHRAEFPMEVLDNIVGVTLPEDISLEFIQVNVYKPTLQYLLTKPIHKSQRLISENEKYGTLSYLIIPNFEFEAELMRLADAIEVISPEEFREKMIFKVSQANWMYEKDFGDEDYDEDDDEYF